MVLRKINPMVLGTGKGRMSPSGDIVQTRNVDINGPFKPTNPKGFGFSFSTPSNYRYCRRT